MFILIVQSAGFLEELEEPVSLPPCQMHSTKQLAKGSIPCMLHAKNPKAKTPFFA